MSLIFLSTKDFPSGKIAEFNIEAAKDGKNADIAEIYESLIDKYAFTFGKVCISNCNDDLWFINSEETTARYITENHLKLFFRFDGEVLLPTEQQFERLREIGGLPSSQYSLHPRNLQFPARIVTKGREEIDLCLFYFSSVPPTPQSYKQILFLNEVEIVSPSALAISHDLRLASTLTDELRMSFYPFMVRTNDHKVLTYDSPVQFASTGKILGSNIVEEIKFSWDLFNKVTDVPSEEITLVIGKWDDEFEELYKRYMKDAKSSSAPYTPSKYKGNWLQKLIKW